MRNFRDRDFIQTCEGFFFCVIGFLHPPDRVISYIKYVPSESGIWGSGENRFNRILQKYTVPNLLETFNFLKQRYPNYLFHSPVDNITMTAVPHDHIKKHFIPEQKLTQLRQAKHLDSLQEKLIRFTKFLEDVSNVSESSFGVTGSLLLDIHQPRFSDIDIIVYGTSDSWNLKRALDGNVDSEMLLRRLKGQALKNWCVKKSQQYPLSVKDALKLSKRKWNLGFFEDKWVSIHPVKLESDVKKEYGQETYVPYGQVVIQAVVCDNNDSIFLPATYKIGDVKFIEGSHFANVSEVVSYESLYDSLAQKGERLQVKGKLERVIEKSNNRQHYRVLVGSAEGKGKEYIKLVE